MGAWSPSFEIWGGHGPPGPHGSYAYVHDAGLALQACVEGMKLVIESCSVCTSEHSYASV